MTPTVRRSDDAHIEFFLPIAPRQKGNSKTIRHRRGRRGAWSNGAMAAALASIGVAAPAARGSAFIASNTKDKAAEDALVRALRPLAPPVPWSGVVVLGVTFVYTVPETFTDEQRADALAGWMRPTSAQGYGHHDRGNALKLLEDALAQAGFYGNDGQVCDGPVSKVFGEVAGYDVRMCLLAGVRVCEAGKRRKRKAKA